MLAKLLTPILKTIGIILKKILILEIRFFYWLKKYFKKIFPEDTIKPIYIFLNKYISHIVIIVLVFIISFANIFTSEIRAETYGEKSILFVLATGSDYEDEYIEEGLISGDSETASYYDQGAISLTESASVDENMDIAFSSDNSSLIKPEIPSLEAATPTRDKIVEYTVQQGDTISTIGAKFGLNQNTILWENSLTATSYIRPGQKLTILPTNGISYKVVKNDNLAKIASRYSIDKNKIIEFNRLADEADIQIGQMLIIPEARPYYPPVVASKPKLSNITKIFTPTQTHVDVPASDKMAWPTTTHRISQYFNWRHIGLDIDGDFGDPIWAAEAGVVIKSICMKTGYGCHVIIDHGNGKTTLYGHFQKLYVKEGQQVNRGDVLGEEGSTGHSTGAHLHFEVRFGGKRYNPLSYIK
ncbi:MAG: M23 family metallopeptidase [Candidatus Parcubacteria bacterium]|nr:M23 family metallopeptidase [Candidatus Parcubacteria bacterium]